MLTRLFFREYLDATTAQFSSTYFFRLQLRSAAVFFRPAVYPEAREKEFAYIPPLF